MKNRLCSQGESVKWSSHCKSRPPAAASSSVARGDRPVQHANRAVTGQTCDGRVEHVLRRDTGLVKEMSAARSLTLSSFSA